MTSRPAVLVARELHYLVTTDLWFLILIRGIEVATPANYFQWDVTISGLQGTCWEFGRFKVKFYFHDQYDIQPPTIYFETVPFHPNIDPTNGKPCVAFLEQKYWRPDIRVTEIIVHLQNLLYEPELENAINEDAAIMYQKSPKLYEQLAKDASISSIRLELGVSIFHELEQEENDTKPSSVEEESVKPKEVSITYNKYYQDWKNTATSLETTKSKTFPIDAGKLLKFSTQNTETSRPQIQKLMETLKELTFGRGFGILEKKSHLPVLIPNTSTTRLTSAEKVFEMENMLEELPGWESEAEELVNWSSALPS